MYRKWCVFCKILNPGTRMLFLCCCAGSNKSWKEVSIVSRADKHWRSNKKSMILASTEHHSCPCVNFLLLSSVLFLEPSNFSKSLLHNDASLSHMTNSSSIHVENMRRTEQVYFQWEIEFDMQMDACLWQKVGHNATCKCNCSCCTLFS